MRRTDLRSPARTATIVAVTAGLLLAACGSDDAAVERRR